MATPAGIWLAQTYHLTYTRSIELRREHGLTRAAIELLRYLVDCDRPDAQGHRKGCAWPAVATMAQATDLAPRTVYHALAQLVAAGLIARRQRGCGRSAVTRLLWPAIASPATVAASPASHRPEALQPAAEARKAGKEERKGTAGRPPRLERGTGRVVAEMPRDPEECRRLYGDPPADLPRHYWRAWWAERAAA